MCEVGHIRVTPQGTEFELSSFSGEVRVHLQMYGLFSVYNALAAATAAIIEGVPLANIDAA